MNKLDADKKYVVVEMKNSIYCTELDNFIEQAVSNYLEELVENKVIDPNDTKAVDVARKIKMSQLNIGMMDSVYFTNIVNCIPHDKFFLASTQDQLSIDDAEDVYWDDGSNILKYTRQVGK